MNDAIGGVAENAFFYLSLDPGLDDGTLADRLVDAQRLEPLTIEEPETISLSCQPRPFRPEDANSNVGWLATVKVPYTGSGVLWRVQLDDRFNAELNGGVGRESARIKDALDRFEVAPLLEFVSRRLDEVRSRLHCHDPGIALVNEYLDRELRGWVAGHRPELAAMRDKVAAGQKPRRAT